MPEDQTLPSFFSAGACRAGARAYGRAERLAHDLRAAERRLDQALTRVERRLDQLEALLGAGVAAERPRTHDHPPGKANGRGEALAAQGGA